MSFQIPRFGLVCGLISTVFMLSMCFYHKKLKKRLAKKNAMALAAFLSALPVIVGMSDKEKSLFKLVVYPLMFRCIMGKFFEIGLVPEVKYGSVIGYFVATFFFGYCTVVEKWSHQP